MPVCTGAPIVHIYESNCASLHNLQNTQVFRDLASVYPSCQQFVHHLDIGGLCDNSVLLECILLLSKLMLPRQPVSMTIEVADLASMS
jgi:hypothetical protein